MISIPRVRLWNTARHFISEIRPGAPRTGPERELLVDVSVIYQNDIHTGIQRVVRGIYENLRDCVASDVIVTPVAATRRCSYRVVPDEFLHLKDRPPVIGLPKVGQRRSGDAFLALDLAAHIQPQHKRQIRRWQGQGCEVTTVVYDLLPVRHPEWFSDGLVRHFGAWIALHLECSDRFLCISQHVAGDVASLFQERSLRRRPDCSISSFMLGSDLGSSIPTSGIDQAGQRALSLSRSMPSILCVGTIEPRKGHEELLDAFLEAATEAGPEWALVIVGRAGWKTEQLQIRLRDLEARFPNIVWLEAASDEVLQGLYRTVQGVVAASYDEGFGLPIVEALAHGVPVLARDIPVFRELETAGVAYFQSAGARDLATAIGRFLAAPPQVFADDLLAKATWACSARAVAESIGLAPADLPKVAACR